MGRGGRHRPRRELRVLRQRVRHPAAVGGRPSGGCQPRPEHGRDGDAPTLARASLRRLPGCVQDPRARRRTAARRPAVRPSPTDALRPLRHRRRRQHSRAWGRHHRHEPPQLLRCRRDVDRHCPQRASGALPRQEGGLRRPRDRPHRRGDGGHPGRAGEWVGRAVASGCRRPRGRRTRRPRSPGDDPAWPDLLRPRAQGALGRGPAAPTHRGTDHPGRHVGHGEGVAAFESPAQRPQPHRSPHRADPRRPARRRPQRQVVEGRHRADHEGDRQAASP